MIATRLRRWLRDRLDLRRIRAGILAERRLPVPVRVDREAETTKTDRETLERMMRSIQEETRK
jgi:hypothetical protein